MITCYDHRLVLRIQRWGELKPTFVRDVRDRVNDRKKHHVNPELDRRQPLVLCRYSQSFAVLPCDVMRSFWPVNKACGNGLMLAMEASLQLIKSGKPTAGDHLVTWSQG